MADGVPVPFDELALTARNRPGLPRIAYAGEDFHDLRARLLARMAEAFPRWNPELAANTGAPDLGVVFVELFARMAAILDAYTDARANEGFLRTATLPRSLIDLAQLIDYRLAPGASASALQVFLAKDGKSGTVPSGYKVQASPASSAGGAGAPLVFETAAALEVDAARNQLRLFGFNRSARVLQLRAGTVGAQDTSARLDQAYPALKAAGQPIVIAFDDGNAQTRIALPIASVVQNQGKAMVSWAPGAAKLDHDFAIADLTVYARPKQTMRLAAAARADEITLGANTLPVANAVMFTKGVAILIAADGLLMPAKVLDKTVTASPAGTITLNRGVVASLRRSSVRVYEGISAGQIGTTVRAGATELVRDSVKFKKDFPHDPNPGDLLLLVDANGVELATAADTVGGTIYLAGPLPRALRPTAHAFDSNPTVRIFIVVPNDPAAHVTALTPVRLGDLAGVYGGGHTVLDLDGTYEELTAGTVVAASDGLKLRAATILANDSVEGKTRLTLTEALDPDMQVARLAIYGPFEFAAHIDGYDKSEATLAAGAAQLELAATQTGLAPGAYLLVAGGGQVEGARVTTVSATGATTVVSLARALEHSYVLGDTVIYGNVAPVTHGATAPDEVLGSGDPSQPSQRFLLRRSPLAFVPDPTAERGVRAAVEIFVDDERWTEAATLADSNSTDKHYALDIDENERAFVQFGDGTFGAQPASGRNNIRARYRVGHGIAANVNADAIAQMPQALPFLQATFNGAAAGGGEERETPEDARRLATHRVRTLGRAVSLGDYADLALTFGGIAKARADWEWEGGRRIVLLTLAATGGGALAGELKEAVYAFFAQRSAAGARLRIRDHRSLPIRLALQITVQRDFTQADVLRRLWQALGAEESDGVRGYFHFDARDLGEDLFLSSVYRIVEGTRGVDNTLATEFHIEGESAVVADRIAVPAEALATGGDATDPARGRLSLQLSGGIA